MKVYAVMAGWGCDIHSEVTAIAYFSTKDKAETYILEKSLLDVADQDENYQVYVETILIDEEH